jgi:3',5'-cyclic-AMP phosphodiesterase
VAELVSVAPDAAELFSDGRVVRLDGLTPDTDYVEDGVAFRTLGDVGEVYSTFATGNDVHFGETVCGHVDGGSTFEEFRTEANATPYPEVMSAAVVADIATFRPDAVIVKGDLTDDGVDTDYERFLEVWGGAFGPRLVHVRGNHDCFRGQQFASWPWQVRELDGVTLALLDTSRPGNAGGFVDAQQCEWLDDLGASSRQPVVVLGHHPVWNPGRDQRGEGFQGIRPDDSARFVEVFARRSSLCGYLAGHTHRCLRQTIGDVPFVEVACVKDFPGAWAEYRACERGVVQVLHRAPSAAAIAWAEKTRAMFDGYYGAYAMGELGDRSFVIETALSG